MDIIDFNPQRNRADSPITSENRPGGPRFDQQFTRKPADLYPTYDACHVVRAIKDHQWLPSRLWEPHSGEGHLAEALKSHGHQVVESDLHPQRQGIRQQDFLTTSAPPEGTGAIVMNPPYKEIDAHLSHALALMMPLGGVVCLLCRSDWAFAAKREEFLTRRDYAGEVKLLWRLRWVPLEQNKHSGRHNYCVQLWDASQFAPPAGTKIIGTGRKQREPKK